MNASRLILVVLTLGMVTGCTAVKVRPVEIEPKPLTVCIKDGQETCYDGDMLRVIQDGFERHGIATKVYVGKRPSECEYHLSYMCNQTWDMAMYMHHAELRLHQDEKPIGDVEYHLKGGGGFSLMKYESTKKKMDPLLDELLGKYPIVESNR